MQLAKSPNECIQAVRIYAASTSVHFEVDLSEGFPKTTVLQYLTPAVAMKLAIRLAVSAIRATFQ